MIGEIGKQIDTLAGGLEKIPPAFYVASALLFLILIVIYVGILPHSKMEYRKKENARDFCRIGSLAVYIAVIAVTAVLAGEVHNGKQLQLMPLNSLLGDGSVVAGVISALGNMALFIPLGILFCLKFESMRVLKTALGAACVSLCAEFAQLICRTGVFDVDDLFFDLLGAMLGAGIYFLFRAAFRERKVWNIILRVVLVAASFAVFCAVGVFCGFNFLRSSGVSGLRQNVSTVSVNMESKDKEAYAKSTDPDLVWYNGKGYRFNDQIVTALFMGIDKAGTIEDAEEQAAGDNGQADTIFLLVLDPVSDHVKALAISRDTMTKIPVFDAKGNYLGEEVNHLALAYSYGDGREKSCQYMVDSVSKLFYGIPVNGYAALGMDAITKINDAVGGVTVTVPEDLTASDPLLKKGETVTLTGNSAYAFIRARDTDEHYSNEQRVQRQKIYLEAFFSQAVQAVQKDYSLPAALYKDLSAQMITNLGMDKTVYLVTKALSMTFDDDSLVVLEGESKSGEVYDEFYVDEDALYEMILETFYIEEVDGEDS